MLTLIAKSLGTLQPPTDAYSKGSEKTILAATNLEKFMSAMIGLITILGGIFFIAYFLLAAIKWLTAGGDSGKIQKARDQIVQAVIGLIVIIAAYSIAGLVGKVLGLNLLNPGTELLKIITLQ